MRLEAISYIQRAVAAYTGASRSGAGIPRETAVVGRYVMFPPAGSDAMPAGYYPAGYGVGCCRALHTALLRAEGTGGGSARTADVAVPHDVRMGSGG